MSEMTTLNVERKEARRFTQLLLTRSVKLGRRISKPEYLEHVATVMEHIESCARCRGMVEKHIRESGDGGMI